MEPEKEVVDRARLNVTIVDPEVQGRLFEGTPEQNKELERKNRIYDAFVRPETKS